MQLLGSRYTDCLSYLMLAEPILLVLNADGTLSGCNPNQRSLVTLWTVPGELLSHLQHSCTLFLCIAQDYCMQ